MTRIASHRGGTLEFGDSTPAGFKATAQMTLEEVEFDLHPTADGAIMVHHDTTLDRTTDRTGAICDMHEVDVRAAIIDYGAGGHPLSLQELSAIYRRSSVDFRCEIKPGPDRRPYAGFVPKVVAMLASEGMLERTVFSSFLIETLDELSGATAQPRLWLVSPPVLQQLGTAGTLEVAKAHGIPEIGVHVDCADAELMAAVEAAGLQFGCWAAHTSEQIENALRLGVKVFTTDRPSLAVEMRKGMREEVRS